MQAIYVGEDLQSGMVTPDLRDSVAASINILTNQLPFQDLKVEMSAPVGDLTGSKKEALKSLIQYLIKENPSHLVSGSYTLNNIESRPRNTMVIIDDGEIVINASQSQLIIMEQEAKTSAIHLVHDLVKQLSQLFVVVSGDKMIDGLKLLEPDNISHNQVYWLQQLDFTYELPDFLDLYHIDRQDSGLPQTELQEIIKKVWSYEDLTDVTRPHVVALDKNSQVMGGARVNVSVQNTAVIGGVKTLPEFRRQGVGMAVSYALTKRLHDANFEAFLETGVDNFPARTIYERIGFEQVGNSAFMDFGTDLIDLIHGDRDY